LRGGNGEGHRQLRLVQALKQLQEERQVGQRATLDQGQDEFALLQADEVIAVFHTRGDALEIQQAS